MNPWAQAIAGIAKAVGNISEMMRDHKLKKAGKNELLLKQEQGKDGLKILLKGHLLRSKDPKHRDKLRKKYGGKDQ
jgi:hypothetical protein